MIRKHNQALFSLPPTHPARRFLEDFIDCRDECVGREIATPDNVPIEQAWFSDIEGRRCTFSSFAYKYLAFDVILDGWLTNAPGMTVTERDVIELLPKLRTLLAECEASATREGNALMIPLLERVKNLFNLWEECIVSRQPSTK